MSMSDVEEIYDVSVVFIRRNSESDFHPAGRRTLEADDTIAIFGGQSQIGRLVNDNL
jgi:K+/H+ antiporter YhaU regulatory subunit KhtT